MSPTNKEQTVVHFPVWIVNALFVVMIGGFISTGVYMIQWNIKDAAHKAVVLTKLDTIEENLEIMEEKVDVHLARAGHPEIENRVKVVERWQEKHDDRRDQRYLNSN